MSVFLFFGFEYPAMEMNGKKKLKKNILDGNKSIPSSVPVSPHSTPFNSYRPFHHNPLQLELVSTPSHPPRFLDSTTSFTLLKKEMRFSSLELGVENVHTQSNV